MASPSCSISTDFEEVAAVCHRALVFKDGPIVREIAASRTDASPRWSPLTPPGAAGMTGATATVGRGGPAASLVGTYGLLVLTVADLRAVRAAAAGDVPDRRPTSPRS